MTKSSFLSKPELENIQNYIPYYSSPNMNYEDIGKKIKLDANESRITISSKTQKVLQNASQGFNLNLYPDYKAEELINKIIKKIGNKSIKPENIIVGNGSEEIIRCVFQVFTKESSEVIIPRPSFILFEKYCKLFSTKKPKYVQVRGDGKTYNYAGNDFDTEIKSHNPSIVVICSPNNPTGNSIDETNLEDLVKKWPSVIFLVDQVYEDPVGKVGVTLVNKYPNIILVRTFSKRVGLAGIRVGFGIGSKDLIHLIDKVKLRYGVNYISQSIALSVLESYKHYKNQWKNIEKIRDRMINRINKETHHFHAFPSNANFFLLKTKNAAVNAALIESLNEHQIFLKDLSEYDHTLRDHNRVTITTEHEMNKLLNVLKSVDKEF